MQYIGLVVLLVAATSAAPKMVSWFEMKPAVPIQHIEGPAEIQEPDVEFKKFKSTFCKLFVYFVLI